MNHSNSGTVNVSFSRPRLLVQEYGRGTDEPGCGGPTGEAQLKPLVLNWGPPGRAANEPAVIAAVALAQEIPTHDLHVLLRHRYDPGFPSKASAACGSS